MLPPERSVLVGRAASPGRATGPVRVIDPATATVVSTIDVPTW